MSDLTSRRGSSLSLSPRVDFCAAAPGSLSPRRRSKRCEQMRYWARIAKIPSCISFATSLSRSIMFLPCRPGGESWISSFVFGLCFLRNKKNNNASLPDKQHEPGHGRSRSRYVRALRPTTTIHTFIGTLSLLHIMYDVYLHTANLFALCSPCCMCCSCFVRLASSPLAKDLEHSSLDRFYFHPHIFGLT